MKLKSMDVTIRGVTKTYEFDPPTSVDSSDEGEASLELLQDAETTEVELVNGVAGARVEVEFSYTYRGSVTVEVEDLEDENIEDENDIIALVERQELQVVDDAMEEDVQRNFESSSLSIDSVDVLNVYDDQGDDVEL